MTTGLSNTTAVSSVRPNSAISTDLGQGSTSGQLPQSIRAAAKQVDAAISGSGVKQGSSASATSASDQAEGGDVSGATEYTVNWEMNKLDKDIGEAATKNS